MNNKTRMKVLSAFIATALVVAMSSAPIVHAEEEARTQEEVFVVVEEHSVEVKEYVIDPEEGYGTYEVDNTLSSEEGQSRNANISQTFTLKKGKSKTFSFTVNGGLFQANHNAVSVVIDTTSGNSYYYMFEDVTAGVLIYSNHMNGHFGGYCYNMDPSHTFEVTVINEGTTPMTLTVNITTFIA